jgi:D-alanyl-D-alanine carboxypeptidase (penicillin-binding protein 5/6)
MAALLDQHLGRAPATGDGPAIAAAKPLDTVEVATLPGVSLYSEPNRAGKNVKAAIMAASTAAVVPADRPTAIQEVASTEPKANAYWQIQISTSPTAEAARRILVEAQSAGGAALLGASPHTDVDSSGKRYRARFIGFASREAAASACSILKKRSYDCLLLRGRS